MGRVRPATEYGRGESDVEEQSDPAGPVEVLTPAKSGAGGGSRCVPRILRRWPGELLLPAVGGAPVGRQ
jgi:hypothetical protein